MYFIRLLDVKDSCWPSQFWLKTLWQAQQTHAPWPKPGQFDIFNNHITIIQISTISIQLGWRDFTGFSPRIQQFSSKFRRELLNSRRKSSNSRRIIRRELLILQKITTKREKRKVNLVATENWTIPCCDENYYSRRDENCLILCCDENSISRRDEICPIFCCDENSNSRLDEICPILYNL